MDTETATTTPLSPLAKMSSRLPLEILTRILDHLVPMQDTITLAALVATSRDMCPLAEKRLYSHIYVHSAPMAHHLLRTWNTRASLAAHVKHLYVRAPERTSSEFWNSIKDIFQRTSTTVTNVTVNLPDQQEGPYVSWILRGLQNGNGTLTTLRVPFSLDTEVKAFLESAAAKSLFRLDLVDLYILPDRVIPEPVTLHADVSSQLTHVEASAAALCAIVPGHPVTTVYVRTVSDNVVRPPNLPPAPELMSKLAQSTAPKGVVFLHIGELYMFSRTETYSLEVLELAPRYLPNLWCLGVVNYPGTASENMSVSYFPRPITSRIYLPCLLI